MKTNDTSEAIRCPYKEIKSDEKWWVWNLKSCGCNGCLFTSDYVFFASIIRVKSLVTENDLFIATDDKILDLSLNIDLTTIYRTR